MDQTLKTLAILSFLYTGIPFLHPAQHQLLNGARRGFRLVSRPLADGQGSKQIVRISVEEERDGQTIRVRVVDHPVDAGFILAVGQFRE